MTSGTVSALSAHALFDSGYFFFLQSTMAQVAWHHGRYGPEEHVFRWLGLLVSLLPLYSFGGFNALMPCIMAGMGQKDSYAAILPRAVVHMPVVCNDRCLELQSAEN